MPGPMTAAAAKKSLRDFADPERAEFAPKFFKTGKGEYGYGDVFCGASVPSTRKVAKQFGELPLNEVLILLRSKVHEDRLLALLILVAQFAKGDERTKKKIYEFYLSNLRYVNNWDLVDSSAHLIVGSHLIERNRAPLTTLARSKDLWKQRVAIIATFIFIRNNDFKDTLRISELLVKHEHDLIHKAVGWMLREVGKRDLPTELRFLNRHYKKMPRTMLRYAIEKFPESLRLKYLNGTI